MFFFKSKPISPFSKLEKAIGYEFKDTSKLKQILTHPTSQNENEKSECDRLEFLGDTLLNSAITIFIYQKYHHLSAGDMTILRTKIVNNQTLKKIARKIHLLELIDFQAGNIAFKKIETGKTLANTFEMVVALIYKECNQFNRLCDILNGIFTPEIKGLMLKFDEHQGIDGLKDGKTKLQEFCRQQGYQPPVYVSHTEKVGQLVQSRSRMVLDEKMLSHFGIDANRQEIAPKKKMAEQKLAQFVLEKINAQT